MRSLLLIVILVPPSVLVGLATPTSAQEEAAPQNDWMVHMDRSTGAWRYIPERPVLVPGGTVQLMVFGEGQFSLVLDDRPGHEADIPSSEGTIRTAEFAAPREPGEYAFHDKYHPEARGVLVVREREAPSPTPVIGVVPGGYESAFSPSRLEVAPGAEIAFQANGSFGHNLQAVDASFTAGDLPPGGRATFRAPTTPGEYAFECRFHKSQGMMGVLVVREGVAAPEAAPPPSTPPVHEGAFEVTLLDNEIEPTLLSAEAGSTLRIHNAGATPHTFTASDGSFDTGRIEPGGTTTVTLAATAGRVHVYCRYHAAASSTPQEAMAADIDVHAFENRPSRPVSALDATGLAIAGILVALGAIAFAKARKQR